ncbi:MAG: SpoIIE family protein phosphatase [Bacteriovoracaceae bacterium]|jgi:phosphoserine phosphatase RsbU/P|nr:SpoIIE family protein phosphatase [Bacteriovoracaceae bacterium]
MSSTTEKTINGKRFISLKYKFLVSQLVIFSISLISFLYYTIDLYLGDKTAYIYENSVSHIESQSNFIEKFLSSELNNSKLLFNTINLYNQKSDKIEIVEKFLTTNDIFLDLVFFKLNPETVQFEKKFSYMNPKILRRYKGNRKILRRHGLLFRELHDYYKSGQDIIFRIINTDRVVPHLYVAIKSKKKKGVYVFRYLIENMASSIFQSSSFTDFITDRSGKVLIHSSPEDVNQEFYDVYSKFFDDIKNAKNNSGVLTIDKATKGEFLVSYKINNVFGIITFSEISKTKAFEFTKLIIFKTIIFGILIGLIILIISLIFTQTITNPLNKLMRRTETMGLGDFESTVTVRSGDEIQLLADSFNFMTRKINQILVEIQDKGQMESELQTAKIVQNSLFPPDSLERDPYHLFGFYDSASECGGDWWGYKESRGKLYLFIGDATGHGVPAALVTASASSCCQTILEYIEYFDGQYARPSDILKLLNSIVLLTGGQKILMTFFVAVYDTETNTIEYSNASHNFPIIYKYSAENPTKKSIQALGKALGRRLGDKPDSEYTNEVIEIADKDVLLLYTDGPVEAVNKENIIWGERKFNKSFFSRAKKDPEMIIKGILEDGYAYFDGVPPEDDVILVATKFKIDGS